MLSAVHTASPGNSKNAPVIRPHMASGCLERNPACGALAASFLLPHELTELLTGSMAVTSGGREPPLVREGEHPPVSSIEQVQGSIKGDGEKSQEKVTCVVMSHSSIPCSPLSELPTSRMHSMDSETHWNAVLRNRLVQPPHGWGSDGETEAHSLFQEAVKTQTSEK